MEVYQEKYLELMRSAAQSIVPSAAELEPEEFVKAAVEANRASRRAVEQGTKLLREELFPLLDNILSASEEELSSLGEFAEKLMNSADLPDAGLYYRIHLALMSYARHKKLRDMLIKELYYVGMALYYLENMLSPNVVRLYTARMRMCFSESASYFEKGYDDIEDPEIRGFIHRSMGNIALSYDTADPASAKAKLDATTRSIEILSDPDVRAKTPSLPWDVYLYKSHQERTTLLSFLRTGLAGPDAFAKVLESAQVVQSRQEKAALERGEPLMPRWQYAYMAAKYHCGAMLLPDLLDGVFSLSKLYDDDDMSAQSLFTHLSAPAIYMEYAKQLKDDKYDDEIASHISVMTRRLLALIVRAPCVTDNEQLMFYIRQFLYVYRECPGGMPFFEVLQNVFAARHPSSYLRMCMAGRISEQLALWASDDCPEKLVGLPGFKSVSDIIWRRDELAEFASKAGRLYDTGMVHFLNLESYACRGLFQEEEELLQLHAHCGAEMLNNHASTAVFADIAHGHHCRYDGKGGYPLNFSLDSSPLKPMICIVAVADALASAVEETSSRFRPVRPFDEVIAELKEGSGSVYAPFVVGLLKTAERREQLRSALEEYRRDACLDMYRRRTEMM